MITKKGWIFGGDNVARLICNIVGILINDNIVRN